MKLILMRHGEYVTDRLNLDVLTENGITQVTNMAAWLNTKGLAISHILHSHKNRATQTATMMAEGLDKKSLLHMHVGLNPGADLHDFAAEISSIDQNVMAVGHMPFMGRLVSYLVCHDENQMTVDFQPGTSVCLMRVGRDQWVIEWVLSPTLFND